MSLIIQSFCRNVQTICLTDNVNDLITYLSTDGLRLLQELLQNHIGTSSNPIECRDFSFILIQLIPICYTNITDEDAEQAFHHLPPLSMDFHGSSRDSMRSVPPLFQTLDHLFDTIVHLFHIHSETFHQSKSEINQTYVDIAEKLVNLSLPPLDQEHQRTLWFYEKFIRTLLFIFRQISAFQPSTLSMKFPFNPLASLINTLHHSFLQFSVSSTPSPAFLRLSYDVLQGLAMLIDRILQDLLATTFTQQRSTTDLFNLIEQYLTSDYFSLFHLFNTQTENFSHSQKLFEDSALILKRLKLCRSDQGRRKSYRRTTKTTIEQTTRLHHHQTNFEILLTNRIATDDDQQPSTRRICIVSALYDKLLRLIVQQFEKNQPNLSFVQNGIITLIQHGSCSCYSLSNYRTFLSKMNHFITQKRKVVELEQQSIQLIRQAFLLISTCSLRPHHHHHHDLALADNTPFWTYLCNHFFQRPTYYSLSFARSLRDLIQYCSIEEKQNAFQLCLVPSLEYYRANSTNSTMMLEYLVRTLPNLLFDMLIDFPVDPFADTLITLANDVPSLLPHILPVLGSLLTSTSDSSSLNISESFVQLIVKLINAWTLNTDGIDNLCHMIVILLQKSSLFRQVFYARHCHTRLYERFQMIMTNQSPMQSSVLSCLLVCVSYYPRNHDEYFNYHSIIEQITHFSEENRSNPSWFELLLRLSLSQLYQDRRTRWKSSTSTQRNPIFNEGDEESNVSSLDSTVQQDGEELDEEEIYPADIESLAEDEQPEETVIKEKRNRYWNIILFPELIMLGLKVAWENIDQQWNDQHCSIQSPSYVTNFISLLEFLSSLLRANTYNCSILKRYGLDEYLFHCLMSIIRRSAFFQKDVLITLIITLLQLIWSQSITVQQLDQCFKLLLTHRSLLVPLLRLFKHLVHQIDPNQPRSYGSMPLSSIVTSKSANQSCLTLEQLFTLKHSSTDHSTNARQSALVTEVLKNVQFSFPLTIAMWLRVNYPFDKHEGFDDCSVEEQGNAKENRPWLHLLTLHHEGIQFQFWLDSTPILCLKLLQYEPNTHSPKLVESIVRLCSFPRQSWTHLFFHISKTTNTVKVYRNGQILSAKNHTFPSLTIPQFTKPWSISLGQQSLDSCTSFYYDLGSILLFDKLDLTQENYLDHLPSYLYSLGSDHWHFLTNGQYSTPSSTAWAYQRFARIPSLISIDQFQSRQSLWHSTLKRHLIASYSSSYPWTLFLFNNHQETNEEFNTSRLTKMFPFRSSSSSSTSTGNNSSNSASIDDPTNSASATISLPSKVSLEQSTHILNVCEQVGGVLNFVYLFGKIIEMNTYPSPDAIVHITDIIFTSIWKIKSYYDHFQSLKGYQLIVKILTSNECARYISLPCYEILIERCLVTNQKRLIDIELFRYLLFDWKIWINHADIYRKILSDANDLLSDRENPRYATLNRQLFKFHFTLEHFLIVCQELLEEQKQFIIDENTSKLLVNIIEALVENDASIIALLINFVLFLHPLIKTYVTYNKEHFYFLSKPFTFFQKRENLPVPVKREKKSNGRQSNLGTSDDQMESSQSGVRKSRSFSNLLDSSTVNAVENEVHSARRGHHLTIVGTTRAMPSSKAFPNSTNQSSSNDSVHQIDTFSAALLALLSNIALTASDRLMMKLIDPVLRLDILIVLLLGSSISKRVQSLKLLDILLKRMDQEKVYQKVIANDLHTMLANQLYHQLDGRDDEKELTEVCLSIALQRPIQLNLRLKLEEQIGDPDLYFSIVTSLPVCYRSQVGFALTLSLIEKLSVTNSSVCEFALMLLDESIQRSTHENRCSLVNFGLPQVLFNTLFSAIATSQERLIVAVQKCLNSLITSIFTAPSNDEISVKSILESIIAIIVTNDNPKEKSSSDLPMTYHRAIHQTLVQMLNSIIESISKPASFEPTFSSVTVSRTTVDELNPSPASVQNAEKLRQFLQIGSDYIHLFHRHAALIESFTLRFLDLCLLGLAYSVEKRSTNVTHRNLWAPIMARSGDTIKPITQKLLVIALDPGQQRYFFRVEILKHINDQPNSKAILEYLLVNENQPGIYQQVLLCTQLLFHTTPTSADYDLPHSAASLSNNVDPLGKSNDSGLAFSLVIPNKSQVMSNGDESSAHTVNLAVGPSRRKSVDVLLRQNTKTADQSSPSSSSESENVAQPGSMEFGAVTEASDNFKFRDVSSNEEHETKKDPKINRSISSFSLSSYSSGHTGSLQSPSLRQAHQTIKTFKEHLLGIHKIMVTTNDSTQTQRRALNDYLLKSFSSTNSRSTSNTLASRFSFNWPARGRTTDTLSSRRTMATTSSLSPTPQNVTWESLIDEKRHEYGRSLLKTIEAIQESAYLAQKSISKKYKEVIQKISGCAMDITQGVITLHNSERKQYLKHLKSSQSLDLETKHLWHQLISQLTHENGIWFEAASYPKFWQLDPTENPQRERRRLQRTYCLMEKRFFEAHVPEEVLVNPPLAYLFDTRNYQAISIQTILHRNEKIEYHCRCDHVTPGMEITGELLVSPTRIYFVADETSNSSSNQTRHTAMANIAFNNQSFNNDSNSFSFAMDDICEMHKRRYMLKDVALELFLIHGITCMIAHSSRSDRDKVYRLLSQRRHIHRTENESAEQIQNSWRQGHLTNFDYLMQLNKLAGRTYLDLMQYPVFPYIVAHYDGNILDLRKPNTYRNLAKPIAIQHPDKEEKFIDMYRALDDSYQLACANDHEHKMPESVSSVFGHQPKPYHYASLYSNSGVVLHYLVRLLPYTRMFLEYQDNNFDCADRTFHDVKTSYWLSSFESSSDFKELIPEFYYLHEFLLNSQNFDFGSRQSGDKVDDVTMTPWSKRNPRLFVYALRQALESEYVTSQLHQWIDLIFGYKQTDKAALDAINVYNAACYYGFPIDDITDEVEQKAYQGIIRTYGQVPKQLFLQPHLPAHLNNSGISVADKRLSDRSSLEATLPADSIHRQVINVRWGDFVGSYDMPLPDYAPRMDCPVQINAYVVHAMSNSLICLPASSLLIYNEHSTNETFRRSVSTDASAMNSTNSSSLDSIIALKWNTSDGIVRARLLKQMKTWYNVLVPMNDQDKITCCTSIDTRLLFIGRASGLIEIYRIQRNKLNPVGLDLTERHLPFIAHRSAITCLYVNRSFSLLISASADGMLTLWDTNRLSYVRTYKQENQRIYHLTSSDTTGDIAYLSSTGSKWYLTYLTCNCELVGSLSFDVQINCLCFTSAPEGTAVNVLFGGFEDGTISMWSTWDLTLLRQLRLRDAHASPIVAICLSKVDRRRLYVADRNRGLHTIESRLSSSISINQSQLQTMFLL